MRLIKLSLQNLILGERASFPWSLALALQWPMLLESKEVWYDEFCTINHTISPVRRYVERTHLLLVRDCDWSENSGTLPFPILLSRGGFVFVKLEVERVLRETRVSRGVAEYDVDSRSFPLLFSFFFAALTLALERGAPDSTEDKDDSGCCCWSWIGGCKNELELLVAS
jgi:hypothetical protein